MTAALFLHYHYPAEGAHPSRLHAQRKELSDLVQTL